MGSIESGQIVYVLPGGWITSDRGMATRAWAEHARMCDPGTVPATYSIYPPTRRWGFTTSTTSGTIT